MSDVFSKIGEGLKTTIKLATEQTQKSVDQVSCRTELLNKKNELKKLYCTLGEAQYKAYIENPESVQDDSLFIKITELKNEVFTLENKIDNIVSEQKGSFEQYKEQVKTSWNDMMTEAEAKEAEDANMADSTVLKICPVCQTANPEDAAFCIKCGNKFE